MLGMESKNRCVWKQYFFFKDFIYVQMCTNPQKPIHSCPKSEIQNFPPSQHPQEWKYKMLREAHSNRLKMKDRGCQAKAGLEGSMEKPQGKLEPVNI